MHNSNVFFLKKNSPINLSLFSHEPFIFVLHQLIYQKRRKPKPKLWFITIVFPKNKKIKLTSSQLQCQSQNHVVVYTHSSCSWVSWNWWWILIFKLTNIYLFSHLWYRGWTFRSSVNCASVNLLHFCEAIIILLMIWTG